VNVVEVVEGGKAGPWCRQAAVGSCDSKRRTRMKDHRSQGVYKISTQCQQQSQYQKDWLLPSHRR
jgi:hypothetical protein